LFNYFEYLALSYLNLDTFLIESISEFFEEELLIGKLAKELSPELTYLQLCVFYSKNCVLNLISHQLFIIFELIFVMCSLLLTLLKKSGHLLISLFKCVVLSYDLSHFRLKSTIL